MKNRLNNSELINSYFEGLFSEEELRWFNRKLTEDRDLASEFRLYLEIDKAIENEDVISLRQQLDMLLEVENTKNVLSEDNYVEEKLLEEIDRAIMEEDVMELRTKLDHLDLTKKEDVKEEEIEHFTSEISEELIFFDDIDNAINESDVDKLREKLDSIHYELEYEMFRPEKALNNNILNYEIDEALSQTNVIGLRANLENIHKEIDPEKKNSQKTPVIKFLSRENSRFTPLKLASSFVILIAGAMISYFALTSSTPADKLYESFIEFDQISTNVKRSAASNVNQTITNAIIAYNYEDYTGAKNGFSEFYKNGNLDNNDKMYYGIICRETGEYDEAVKIFKDVIDGSRCSNTEPSIWHLGMTFLKYGENDLAIEQFAKLAEEEEAYNYDKAKRILRKIRRE